MLQQYVKTCQKQITQLHQANEELEHYSRKLCLRNDGFLTFDNETSDKVFDKVKFLIKETSCDIPDVVIDRAQKSYNDKKTNVRGKSITYKFKIFTKAIETVKSYDNVIYVMVDINCRLKVVFKDWCGIFFTDNMSLQEVLLLQSILVL